MAKTRHSYAGAATSARPRRFAAIALLGAVVLAGSLSGVPAQGDTQAPIITGHSPAAGSGSVGTTVTVTATFSEPVQPASIAFSLKNAANVLVPATVAYDAPTRTVKLDPTSDLSPSSTFTATVSGAADLAGNVLTQAVTWSFSASGQGFVDSVVFSGLVQPTSVQFAADGRIFVAEKSGTIKVFDSLSDTTPTVFADLNVNVYNYGSAGLTGLALDPTFPTRPYVYVLYAYDAAIGGVAPRWGIPGVVSDPCPDPVGQGCVVSGRLTRLQANGNIMTGPETVLVADWFQQFANHSVGGLSFGPDGALYASAGDGAGLFVDSGQIGNPNNDPTNEGGALRSQDLRTPADPTTLDGAIIRIDPNTGKHLPRTSSMVVGPSTVDGNNVRTFPVTSVFQGPNPTEVRILEPTNPAPGKPHRFMYVLPVEVGVASLESPYSDGLEELRLLDVPNRFNVTLIAPSFIIEPWYGDHVSDLDRRLESFIVKDLVPFGDTFAAPGEIIQRWLIGFSKSATGALSLILRNPNVFNAAAAWDGPAQFTNMSAFFGMVENFGTEANFDLYEIPPLVLTRAEAFRARNRLWISGDESAWTSHMMALHTQLGQAAVLHTWLAGGSRLHSWYSGWLEGAVVSLDANAAASSTSLDANANRIVAYGLRNPSRFTFRPGTREIWLGDAGVSGWEEINRLTDASDGVLENFGSPCYEGQATTSYAGLSICTKLSAQPSARTQPFFMYQHGQPIGSGDSCAVASSSIAGLAFYGTGNYPALYQGALFFADYARNCIAVMLKGPTGLPDPATRATVLSNAAGPVDLKVGPGGDLFYPSLDTGTVRRIQYERGNLTPTAVAQASPTSGEPLLAVAFNGAGSTDPEGDTLTYAWDLDDDGLFDDGASAQAAFTYVTPGARTVRLRVTDSGGLSDVAAVVVVAHNTPPVASIASPIATATWAVGETVSFSGGATDGEEGTLAASALSWSIVLHDCLSSCTQQTIQNVTGVATGSFVAPDNRYPSHIEIRLTATDAGGLQSTASVLINPRTATLNFQSVPTGLSLAVGGVSSATPFTRTVIANSRNTIAATTPQVLGATAYQFSSWSDGGAQSHDVTPVTSTTYTATYVAPSVTGLVAAYNFNEASGTSVLDSSGNNLMGSITGATRVAGGKAGGALSFNGSSNLVTVNSTALLNLTTGMTLEAWVNPTTLGSAWRNVLIKETYER